MLTVVCHSHCLFAVRSLLVGRQIECISFLSITQRLDRNLDCKRRQIPKIVMCSRSEEWRRERERCCVLRHPTFLQNLRLGPNLRLASHELKRQHANEMALGQPTDKADCLCTARSEKVHSPFSFSAWPALEQMANSKYGQASAPTPILNETTPCLRFRADETRLLRNERANHRPILRVHNRVAPSERGDEVKSMAQRDTSFALVN